MEHSPFGLQWYHYRGDTWFFVLLKWCNHSCICRYRRTKSLIFLMFRLPLWSCRAPEPLGSVVGLYFQSWISLRGQPTFLLVGWKGCLWPESLGFISALTYLARVSPFAEQVMTSFLSGGIIVGHFALTKSQHSGLSWTRSCALGSWWGCFSCVLLALLREEGIVIGPMRPRDYPRGLADPYSSVGFRLWIWDPEKGCVIGT